MLVCCGQRVLRARVGAGEGGAARALQAVVPGRHAHGATRGGLQAWRVRARRGGRVREEQPDTDVC